jgi:hypothetical protein
MVYLKVCINDARSHERQTDHRMFVEVLSDQKLLDVCVDCSELRVGSLLHFMESMLSGLATYTVVCGMAVWLRAEPFNQLSRRLL